MADVFKVLGLEKGATHQEVMTCCDQLLKELQKTYVTNDDAAILKKIKQVSAIRDDFTDPVAFQNYVEISSHNRAFFTGTAKSFGLPIVMGGVIIAAIYLMPSNEAPVRTNESGAFTACQEFVRRGLKAPSTADFASYSNSKVDRDGKRFLVSSHVDAQNSFGAKIRSEWVCDVEEKYNSWSLKSLNINSR